MATIKNTTTGEITDVSCITYGQDCMDDVLGNAGTEMVELTDEEMVGLARIGMGNPPEEAWALDDYELDWWRTWARREERLTEAYEDANDEERAAYEDAAFGETDLERIQDLQEIALGLA